MEFYKADAKLKAFLPIIESSIVYPVLYDSKRTVSHANPCSLSESKVAALEVSLLSLRAQVLSLPPIINGAHSAISLATRNVFIECTATDLTKAHIVLNVMIAMFSQYAALPFTVEPVEVIDQLGRSTLTPDLAPRSVGADMAYVNRCSGARLPRSRTFPCGELHC